MKAAAQVGIWAVVALVAAGAPELAQAGAKRAKQASQEQSQSGSSSASATSSAGISVRSVNGQTTVSYKGEEVFSGQTSGQVSALSSSVNGVEYAAAFDGDKVLWENTSGAAARLRPAEGAGGGAPALKKAKKKRGDA